MAKFFSDMVNHAQIEAFSDILDWLLDDLRFVTEHWDKAKKDRFTKRAKKAENLKKENWISLPQKSISWVTKRPEEPFVQMQAGTGQGEDLVRHIRNGIAHGHTSIKMNSGELWLEIEDYSQKRKQTAYLWIPIEYLRYWNTLYREIERSERSVPKKRFR